MIIDKAKKSKSEMAEWDKGYIVGYEKGRADALLIDMDKPMHFTDEQKAWIKNYIIINAKRQRADAIDEYKKAVLDAIVDAKERGEEHCVLKVFLDSVAEQLKEQKE